jgi:cytochrome c oxidase cbb3-type subunit III
MKVRPIGVAAGLMLLVVGCSVGCGRRTEEYTLPDQIADFAVLYSQNCAGCHGNDGRGGAAQPLNDPLYQALIGKQGLREVIAKGVPNTAMPPFAEEAGGTITDLQIDILSEAMQTRWSRPQDFAGISIPPYSGALGDPYRGQMTFETYCAGCHGSGGTGGAKAGSVVDPAFLALVSNQHLRTMVIAGRADQGIPDWRSDSPGRVMTPQEISDTVAWLSKHRESPDVVARGGVIQP